MKNLTLLFVATLIFLGLPSGIGHAQELLIKNGQTIAFLGDSITQEGGHAPGGYVNLVMEGLQANGIQAHCIKAGIRGHKSNDMLARVDADVISKKPDLMTLSCGVNDAWQGENGILIDAYKKNITSIVDKAQAANIKVVILTATLIGKPDSELSLTLKPYNEFLRSFAQQRKIPLADLNADMTNIMIEKGDRSELTYDGVHMSIRGNEMMAKGVLRTLGLSTMQMNLAKEVWLDMSRTVSFNIPLTLRQLNQLSGRADKTPNQPQVYQFIADQFNEFVSSQEIPNDPSSVSILGTLEQTSGQLTIDTTAPAGSPVATLNWTGKGTLGLKDVGTHGYVLFRHRNNSPTPTRRIYSPFIDTFTVNDQFHYADGGSDMQFDLLLADGKLVPGVSADGHVYFGSVNSNAGVSGKPETYPKAQWKISVADKKQHTITIFSPGKSGYGAKERFKLTSMNKPNSPVFVEFDGTQGGVVVQFQFVGTSILSVEQTVGGMGSSPTGANCAAIFLD